MRPDELETLVRNIDARTQRMEQILPTLPTRDEMHAAMRAAAEPLSTREEMHAAIGAAIGAAVEPLATKADLAATKMGLQTELREEGERTRRHFDVVGEGLRDNIRVIAEGQVALQQRFDAFETDLKGELARLDRPVTRLEAKRRSRPS